jgi:hypothetical protein
MGKAYVPWREDTTPWWITVKKRIALRFFIESCCVPIFNQAPHEMKRLDSAGSEIVHIQSEVHIQRDR